MSIAEIAALVAFIISAALIAATIVVERYKNSALVLAIGVVFTIVAVAIENFAKSGMLDTESIIMLTLLIATVPVMVLYNRKKNKQKVMVAEGS